MSNRLIFFLFSLALRAAFKLIGTVFEILGAVLALIFAPRRPARRAPRRRRGGPARMPRLRLPKGTSLVVSGAFAIDGDTLSVDLPSGENLRIRIYGIDAPESDQMHGPCATLKMRQMISGAQLKIRPIETDRYGRLVARVVRVSDGVDVGQAMVAAGYARAAHRYAKRYVGCERRARARRRGLWANRGGIPDPAAHRAAQRG